MTIQEKFGWVFLKLKCDAFDKFKEWKLLVENQTGKRIQHLRTDNGLEYYSNEFTQFCIKFGLIDTGLVMTHLSKMALLRD